MKAAINSCHLGSPSEGVASGCLRCKFGNSLTITSELISKVTRIQNTASFINQNQHLELFLEATRKASALLEPMRVTLCPVSCTAAAPAQSPRSRQFKFPSDSLALLLRVAAWKALSCNPAERLDDKTSQGSLEAS